jgi:YidC/Oxa1 family membrane protein insertase
MDFFVQIIHDWLVLFHSLIPNWGLSIIFLTATIRIALLPLQALATREQVKLQKLKPQLERLQSLYKDNVRQLLEERSTLLRDAGAKPWLSLMAVVVQLPIFVAMYKSLTTFQLLEPANFAWIPNLAIADPLFILPILTALVMGAQSWIQSRQSEQSPKALIYAMPIVGFAFLATVPAGVALYALTSSMVQLIGQVAIERFT